jgi:hypothetical protein
MDVAIDQGGTTEQSFPTTLEYPIIKYKNMAKVRSGEAKINVTGILPHELANYYVNLRNTQDEYEENETIELQWKSIVDNVKNSGILGNSLAIVDLSGSMFTSPKAYSCTVSGGEPKQLSLLGEAREVERRNLRPVAPRLCSCVAVLWHGRRRKHEYTARISSSSCLTTTDELATLHESVSCTCRCRIQRSSTR